MWLYLAVGLILFMVIAPILIVIPMSFSSASFITFPPPGFSTKWYHSFLENDAWIDATFCSLQVGVGTVILSLILGTMAALAVTKLEFKGKGIIMGIFLSPTIVPVVVVGIAMYRFFSEAHILGTTLGLILAHTLIALPIVIVAVTTSLQGVDRNLELAAMGLGSTPIEVFFKVTLPLIKPGIFSGAVFAFITSLDEIVVTIFISGPSSTTLPKLMWDGIRTEIDPTITAASTLLIVGTTLLFLLQAWISGRQGAKQG